MGCGGSKDTVEPSKGGAPTNDPNKAGNTDGNNTGGTQDPSSQQPKYKPPPGFPTPKLLEQCQRDYAQTVNDTDKPREGADGLPSPVPPTKARIDVFDREEYAYIRKQVLSDDKEVALSSFKEAADLLGTYADDDIGKLYALFFWVLHTAKNLGNYDFEDVPPRDSVLYAMYLAHAEVTTSFNMVLKSLCHQAGFEAKTIEGNVKTVYNSDHVVGEKNSWISVLVGQQWYLIDVNFAIKTSERQDLVVQENGNTPRQSQSKETVDEYEASDFYFLAEPTAFIFTHYTEQQEWQLLAKPVIFEEFKTMAHLTEFYFLLGFDDVQKASGVLVSDNGHVSIDVLTGNDSKLKLFTDMVKLAGKETLTSMNGVNFNEQIMVYSENAKKKIEIDFLHVGRYGLKVWAVDVVNDPRTRKLIAQWFIQVNKPMFTWEPKPDNPLAEYGPSAELEICDIDMKVESIDKGLVHVAFECKDRLFELKHKLESKTLSASKLRQNHRFYTTNEHSGLILRFPEHGMILLQSSVKEIGSKKSFRHVCTLNLKEDMAYHDPTAFPSSPNGRIGHMIEGEKAKMIPVSHPVPYFRVKESENLEILMRSNLQLDIMTQMNVYFMETKTPEDVSNYVWSSVEKIKDYLAYMFQIRCPKAGLYSLTLFSRKKGDKGVYREMYKYMFVVDNSQRCLPFPSFHERWDSSYKIESPLDGYLKEHTQENLTAFVPDATEVVVFHSGSPKYQNLQLGQGGHFSGQIQTLEGDSTLTVAARFPDEKNIKNLIQYEVLVDEEWNEHLSYQEEAIKEANERTEALQAYRELEEKEAEIRKKKREQEIEQRELEWMEFRDDYFEQELKLQEEFEEQFKAKEEEKEAKSNINLTHDEKDAIVKQEMKLIFEEQDVETRRRRKMYKELSDNLHKKKLIQAIKTKNKKNLQIAITDAKRHGFTHQNSPELKKAERLLDVIETREELKESNKARDVDNIILIIDDIMAKRYHGEMQYEVSEGEAIINAALRAENLNTFILGMEKTTMSEIRSYQKPPTAVHQVMQGTLLLLGEDEFTTASWPDCAALSNPYGPKGLNRRVQNFNMESVHPEVRERAREIFDALDFKQVRNVSTGAATFYVWALGQLEEYDKNHEQDSSTHRSGMSSSDDVKPADIARQREIFCRTPIGADIPQYQYGRQSQSQKEKEELYEPWK